MGPYYGLYAFHTISYCELCGPNILKELKESVIVSLFHPYQHSNSTSSSFLVYGNCHTLQANLHGGYKVGAFILFARSIPQIDKLKFTNDSRRKLITVIQSQNCNI